MKKILPYILIISIFLCGCNRANLETHSPTQPLTEETVSTEPETTVPKDEPADENSYFQQPMFAVALPLVTETAHDEGKSFIYQDIHLFCQDQEVADRIIVDYLNRQDSHRITVDKPNSTAYQILYQPARLDPAIMSLHGESVLHQGKNHPVIECETLNYSMITGEVLTLGSILQDSSAHEKLQDALLFSAESAAEEKQLYSDYPQIIADRFKRNISTDEDWFFTSSGLAFFFDPYEIAPYTSGIVTLEIPYERLLGILDNSYFPVEEDRSNGSLCAATLDDVTLENYTQMAELYISGYSSGIMLFSDGIIRDVRIEVVPENTGGFGASIFATSTLTPGDGIMLMYDPQVNNPILKITYRDGENVVTRDLYFDKSGTFVLT